jgi:16S rRNA (guanine1207-N2)-methyltransferase
MNLTPPSQLLLRNLDTFEEGFALINPPQDQLLSQPLAYLKAVYGYDARLKAKDVSVLTQAAFETQDQKIPAWVIFWPKAKQQGMMMLENWLHLLSNHQDLYLIGENRSGIKSIAKPLTERGIILNKVDSARHCLLFRVQVEQEQPAFNLQEWFKEYRIAVDGSPQNIKTSELSIYSLPGVFSHGTLDMGTRLLLDTLPALKGTTFADIGCGAGVISAYLARQHPKAQVIASDVNELALASTQRTATSNALHNLQIIAADGLTEFATASLDVIITNPPFHEGLKTHYDVTLTLLTDAKRCLKPGGQLILVANQFLDYESTLNSQFSRVHSLQESHGFKIIVAS